MQILTSVGPMKSLMPLEILTQPRNSFEKLCSKQSADVLTFYKQILDP